MAFLNDVDVNSTVHDSSGMSNVMDERARREKSLFDRSAYS